VTRYDGQDALKNMCCGLPFLGVMQHLYIHQHYDSIVLTTYQVEHNWQAAVIWCYNQSQTHTFWLL